MKKLTFLKAAIVISLFCFISSTRSLATNSWVYVDHNAVGNNDGSSWANAYNFLQDALADSYGHVILVARGTYYPDRDSSVPDGSGDRSVSFYIGNNAAIYGGFAGHGAPDPNARDVKLYETILSGDLDGNDIYVDDPANLLTEPTRAGNSYNVLFSSDNDTSTLLDGFTITGGNGNNDSGGGMSNSDSNCIIKNCTFRENASEEGGAILNYQSNVQMSNCIFFRNSATYDGGAMTNYQSSPALINCIFTSNSTEMGSILNYGGSNPEIINCLFNHNSTMYGGGIFNYSASSPTITNCTFWGNSATEVGGGILDYNNANPTITNCIFWDNISQIYDMYNSTATVNYSDIQGGWTGTGNINANPRFVNANGLDGISGTLDDDLRLSLGWSPCIDKGHNSSVPADIADLDNDGNTIEQTPLDLDNTPRFEDGDCNSTVIVDMGAYESTSDDPAAPTPNPMTFETAPYATSNSSVTMVATTAADISGIEYYFTNITDPNHNSGWQESTTYTDTGLQPFTIYTYTVKARDMSCSHNETAASNPASTSALVVTPSQEFVFAGYAGGPFMPVGNNYTLLNNSTNSLDWTAEANVPWLNVSPGSGTLASNQSTAVTASINAEANSLAAGNYHTKVKFTDLTSDSNQTRPVTLMVQAIDAPIGWVTMSDGNVPFTITGGSAGDTVTVTDPNSLRYYAGSSLPYTILVSGTITMPRGSSSSDTPQTINVESNKTIIGIGSNPGVNGGFMISGKSNIIIRNIKIWYRDSINQGSEDPWTDGISINGSQHIWIDHCNIFDSPDGLCDPTKQSNYLTISWNKFYYTPDGNNSAHCNSCLVGSDDGTFADRGKLKETFHHNWWGTNCKERMPRVRFGKVHVFNNYYSNLQSGGYCQGVGVECQIRVENNYYDAVPLPWKNYSQAGGPGKIGWNSGNVFYNCSVPDWAPNNYNNIFVPPYAYTLDAGEDVKDIVRAGAGVNADGDLTPPTPNPMTFATAPYAVSYTSIAMVATTATDDAHGVEYYFTCTNYGGLNSGWQDSASYTAVNLSPSTTYTYTVKARDKSACQNETAASAPASATTLADIFAPTPNPMTFATAPYAISDLSISMVATTATDVSGVEYYFTCTAGIGHDSDWQNSPTYTDTGLTENSTCTYTVKARDKSIAHNQTADSNAASATTQADIFAPTPNPMTFYVGPYTIDPHSISMTATTAIDGSGVEYYFTCTAGSGHDSAGWQDSTTYIDTGLAEGSTCSYTVTARDKHPEHHTTAPSNPETATTMLDTTAPTPNPMTWATDPCVISSLSITMVATTATDSFSGVEYYFANITDPNHNSGWQDSTTYSDTGLTNKTTYTYRVKARDKSFSHNETGWSNEANATARYVCSGTISSDLDEDCDVDFADFALMASQWGEALPLTNNIAVNGTFDTNMISGWRRFDLPSAEGMFDVSYDGESGNPPGSVMMFSYPEATDVHGYYFYQVIPVNAGKQYKLSAEWTGDLSGSVASDPCHRSNWAQVLVAFETNADANTWTVWTDSNAVMYGKVFGVANRNIDSSGTWPTWEPITASQINGPADGVFTASGNYMVVAFSEGGLPYSYLGYFWADNVKAEAGCSPIDLNNDCNLDWLDIEQLATDWLTCNRNPIEDCWQ